MTPPSPVGRWLSLLEWLGRFVYSHRRLVATVAYVGCSYAFRLGIGRWRFVSARDMIRLSLAVTCGSVIFLAATWYLPFLPWVPRSVILVEWVLSGYFTASLWLAYRVLFERLRRPRRSGTVKRVLMIGAGEAGQMLVHEMLRSPLGYRPVAFADDDPFKWGTTAHGVEVIGSTADIASLAAELDPDEIVIAIPSATPDQLRAIVERCEQSNVSFKILPGIAEVLGGDAHLHQLREVRVEDLLGRQPVQLQLPELSEELAGRTVLITGAAGSIGAELSRQVALHGPARLILVDTAETPLYFIDLELRDRHRGLDVLALIIDVADRDSVRRVFEDYLPDRVFHAAAYKHVPLMESHPRQAVRANVLGTWQVAEAAGLFGAESFVLVSTDKAVRPVNVMGATKRLAELIVLHLKNEYPRTCYGAVRFGNVLGSSGSVIPLFRWQMENGKPLTVTHAEVTRYFMTIPEAVQLILQASLLPDLTGRVAMLEMGRPVKIMDLAKNLLRLSGRPFRPGENVVFIGLRPGEKLHEELLAPEERVVDTPVPRVKLLGTADEGLGSAAVRSLMGTLADDDLDLALHRFHMCFPFLGGVAQAVGNIDPSAASDAAVVAN